MPRILVADDDLELLTLHKLLLEAGGHQVAVSPCAGHALAQIAHAPADLIVMDLRFPNPGGEPDAAEGIALIRRIRESGCSVPVIVLSGWPEELYGQPEESMVSRVMVKPVGMADLLGTIAELLA